MLHAYAHAPHTRAPQDQALKEVTECGRVPLKGATVHLRHLKNAFGVPVRHTFRCASRLRRLRCACTLFLVWMSHGYNVDGRAAVFDALTNSYLNGHTLSHLLTRAAQHRRAGG